MSVTGNRGVGIPTILLHDADGTIVTIELRTGETYRGYLSETEDNMNCTLTDAVRTDIYGNVSECEQVYLRGSQIVYFLFPDMLKHAPMFKRVTLWKKSRGSIQGLGEQGSGAIGPARGQAGAIMRKTQQRGSGHHSNRGAY